MQAEQLEIILNGIDLLQEKSVSVEVTKYNEVRITLPRPSESVEFSDDTEDKFEAALPFLKQLLFSYDKFERGKPPSGFKQLIKFVQEIEKLKKGKNWDPASIVQFELDDVEVSDEYVDKRIKVAIKNGQVGYLPDVKLKQIGASPIYEVVEDYAYRIDYEAIRRTLSAEQKETLNAMTTDNVVPYLTTLTARKGFQFDRASIPRIFWVIISKDDLSNVPPLFHDLLYRFSGVLPSEYVDPYETFIRAEADNLFLHLMKRTGVVPWRALLASQAVKKFAWTAWKSPSVIPPV